MPYLRHKRRHESTRRYFAGAIKDATALQPKDSPKTLAQTIQERTELWTAKHIEIIQRCLNAKFAGLGLFCAHSHAILEHKELKDTTQRRILQTPDLSHRQWAPGISRTRITAFPLFFPSSRAMADPSAVGHYALLLLYPGLKRIDVFDSLNPGDRASINSLDLSFDLSCQKSGQRRATVTLDDYDISVDETYASHEDFALLIDDPSLLNCVAQVCLAWAIDSVYGDVGSITPGASCIGTSCTKVTEFTVVCRPFEEPQDDATSCGAFVMYGAYCAFRRAARLPSGGLGEKITWKGKGVTPYTVLNRARPLFSRWLTRSAGRPEMLCMKRALSKRLGVPLPVGEGLVVLTYYLQTHFEMHRQLGQTTSRLVCITDVPEHKDLLEYYIRQIADAVGPSLVIMVNIPRSNAYDDAFIQRSLEALQAIPSEKLPHGAPLSVIHWTGQQQLPHTESYDDDDDDNNNNNNRTLDPFHTPTRALFSRICARVPWLLARCNQPQPRHLVWATISCQKNEANLALVAQQMRTTVDPTGDSPNEGPRPYYDAQSAVSTCPLWEPTEIYSTCRQQQQQQQQQQQMGASLPDNNDFDSSQRHALEFSLNAYRLQKDIDDSD